MFAFNNTKWHLINNLCIQVDILISKNQALQILYLKHCIYRAVSRIIILAARNITCGKNDRSKMKD